jgi:hypothetical protein
MRCQITSGLIVRIILITTAFQLNRNRRGAGKTFCDARHNRFLWVRSRAIPAGVTHYPLSARD